MSTKFILPYKPLQINIQADIPGLDYEEVHPAVELREYIYCYWFLNTKHVLSQNFEYRVLADGCVDVFLDIERMDEVTVMGFSNSYSLFPLGNKFNFIGIRFMPAGFFRIFNIDASELAGGLHNFHEIRPDLATFISNAAFDHSKDEMVSLLNTQFIKIISRNPPKRDPRFLNAMEIIIKSRGNLKLVSQLDTGISSRQLRRFFNSYIGGSVKDFARIIRFQHLYATSLKENILESKEYYEMGFFDQSHFVKEVKQFMGLTPKHLISKP